MDDSQIRSIVRGAGAPMPSEARANVRAAIEDELHGAVAPVEVVALASRRRWPWVAGALAAVAAVVAALIWWPHPEPSADVTATLPATQAATSTVAVTTTAVTTTATPTTAVATTTEPTTTVPPTTTGSGEAPVRVPSGVVVRSMSWPSMSDGWAAAFNQDLTVAGLLHTTDAGRTWTRADMPATDVSQVLFADTTNGWVIGDESLRSTHDGGASWQAVTLPHGGDLVGGVAAASGTVHVAYLGTDASGAAVVRIASSPVGRDAFVAADLTLPVGAGPRFDVTLTAGGPYAALVYQDRVLSGAAQISHGAWTAWTDLVCPFDNPVAEVALSPQGKALTIACGPSGFGDTAPVVAADLSAGGSPLHWSTVQAAPPSSDGILQLEFAAATDAGVRVVGYSTPSGDTVITSSTNGGRTWPVRATVPANPNAPAGVVQLPGGGLLLPRSDGGSLYSADGITWTGVSEGTAPAIG